jgi:Z1 domain
MHSENIGYIESALLGILPIDRPPTEAEVVTRATQLRAAFPVSEDEFEALLRRVYTRVSITMDLGVALVSEHRPWLNARKPSIDPFYWQRFEKLLKRKEWPPQVVGTLDRVSDEILDLLGNPAQDDRWKRRGLVVGDVQSGKTATYTALTCKAGDAGYRLIILLTGTLENLRRQTQERMDEGFVGLDSSGELTTVRTIRKNRNVGVGLIDGTRAAGVFTSRLKDFNKELLNALGFRLDAFKIPVLVVMKKNRSILLNLEKWLVEFNAGSDGKITAPVLVIDDEADNASVNTRKNDEDPAEINRRIRSLLERFTRSSYVGFTATPFANVFIDPDTNDEMLGNDLFPRDFIYALEAPSNYFGPQAIFGDEPRRDTLRFIEDADPLFPPRHKSTLQVNSLPASLLDAARSFLLATTIRDLRGEGPTHRSMLVNVSHYTNVQEQVVVLLYTWLSQVQQDIRNYSQLDSNEALRNGNLTELKHTWEVEFTECGLSWEDIQAGLVESILPISIKAVNQRTGAASLDFVQHKETGLRVIVVGGNSLSRGLTLEGLSTSYFYRSTKMYDSLLQMGRWFGYRDNYEDLCRVWLADEAVHWYAHIAAATDELRQELRRMREERRKPIDFGLKVRAHPGALIVTAQNKMRKSTLIKRVVSIGGKSLETTYLKTRDTVVSANRVAAEKLVRQIGISGNQQQRSTLGNPLWTAVPKHIIADFLLNFIVDPANITFQSRDLAAFIESTSEPFLQTWDVVLPQGEGELSSISGISVHRNKRKVRVSAESVLVSGKSARIASRGIEREGLEVDRINELIRGYKADNPAKSIPDSLFRAHRPRPLLLLHLIEPKSAGPEPSELPNELIGVGLSFMDFDDSGVAKQVEYRINLVELRSGEEVEDEDDLGGEGEDDVD